MPSEMRRPPIPATPQLWDSIEHHLRRETTRRRRLNHQSRLLQPLLTAGAAMAGVTVLALALAPLQPIAPPDTKPVVAAAADSNTLPLRVPTEDLRPAARAAGTPDMRIR